MLRISLILILAILSPLLAMSQVVGVERDDLKYRGEKERNIGIAYYNVDKLYDTIPSRFYDDTDYTPRGKYRWDSERYNHKVRNIVRVIDSMRMPIVMLYGVESEAVVKDIVELCREDYAYIHRTIDYTLGLDFALIYYGDLFFPERITSWYKALCVEGYMGDSKVAIIGQNRSNVIGVLLNELEMLDEESKIILLGCPNKTNFEKFGLQDHLGTISGSGYGNCVRGGRWEMCDRIYSNIGEPTSCGVYIKSWLMGEASFPQPTFGQGRYYGGYSNFLPVYTYFGNLFAH